MRILLLLSLSSLLAAPGRCLAAAKSKHLPASEIIITADPTVTFGGDSLILSVYEGGVYDGQYYHTTNRRQLVSHRTNGAWRFSIPIQTRLSRFSLFRTSGSPGNAFTLPVLFDYLIQAGDKVHIGLTRHADTKIYGDSLEFTFRGRGAVHLQCQRNMFKALLETTGDGIIINADARYKSDNHAANLCRNRLAVLTKFKPVLPADLYQVLALDTRLDAAMQHLNRYRQMMRAAKTKDEQERLVLFYANLPKPDVAFADSIKIISTYYTQYITLVGVVDEINLTLKNSVDYRKVYQQLKSSTKGILRDKLLADFLLHYNQVLPMKDSLAADAVAIMGATAYQQAITPYLHARAGASAFNFALQDIDGQIRRLDDMRGKVVFIDFWFTGCSPCRLLYAQHLKRVKQHFKDEPSVIFVTVSVDADRIKWEQSVKSGAYTDAQSLNLITNGMGTDHPMIKHYGITGYPSLLLIDQVGKIAHTPADQSLRTFEGISAAIASLLKSTAHHQP